MEPRTSPSYRDSAYGRHDSQRQKDDRESEPASHTPSVGSLEATRDTPRFGDAFASRHTPRELPDWRPRTVPMHYTPGPQGVAERAREGDPTDHSRARGPSNPLGRPPNLDRSIIRDQISREVARELRDQGRTTISPSELERLVDERIRERQSERNRPH